MSSRALLNRFDEEDDDEKHDTVWYFAVNKSTVVSNKLADNSKVLLPVGFLCGTFVLDIVVYLAKQDADNMGQDLL